MNNERVKPKIAAKELQMDVITLRELTYEKGEITHRICR